MDLYQTQNQILKNENEIQTFILNGINGWNKENEHAYVETLSPYMKPLIRYALEDWMNEYEKGKPRRPDTRFSDYIKEQESNLIFHFKWSLTHKSETVYRHAHEILWRALTKEEQNAFLYGLRYLIAHAKN